MNFNNYMQGISTADCTQGIPVGTLYKVIYSSTNGSARAIVFATSIEEAVEKLFDGSPPDHITSVMAEPL